MKEVYLVKWSADEYDDYREYNKETVFLSLLSAEKTKKEIEDSYNTENPFPLEHSDEYNFDWKIASDEDYDLYSKWQDKEKENRNFNTAWIEALSLEE